MIEEAEKMIATILKFEYIENLIFYKSGVISAKLITEKKRAKFGSLLELVEEAEIYEKNKKK